MCNVSSFYSFVNIFFFFFCSVRLSNIKSHTYTKREYLSILIIIIITHMLDSMQCVGSAVYPQCIHWRLMNAISPFLISRSIFLSSLFLSFFIFILEMSLFLSYSKSVQFFVSMALFKGFVVCSVIDKIILHFACNALHMRWPQWYQRKNGRISHRINISEYIFERIHDTLDVRLVGLYN